eukprot:SAG31_NODE_5474_length_2518_cov_544.966102_2_plen_57_part_00
MLPSMLQALVAAGHITEADIAEKLGLSSGLPATDTDDVVPAVATPQFSVGDSVLVT